MSDNADDARLKEALEALRVSEAFREAYRSGKLALYAIGGEVGDAAMRHLPMSEGPLERGARRLTHGTGPDENGWITAGVLLTVIAEHGLMSEAQSALGRSQRDAGMMGDLLTDVMGRPLRCPRCGAPHVVPGHSVGITGAVYPMWVCDVQTCGIAVAWRFEHEPCGTSGCPNEHTMDDITPFMLEAADASKRRIASVLDRVAGRPSSK